ncbi:MAG: hypothetical protein QOK43_2909 [Acidimicrobiaceae bacterium]|nr:hypothetical protein [Acidimicrobiaceae bacterium]
MGIEDLRRVYEEHDEALRRDWQRSLPLGDAVLDRWQRAQRLGFGAGTSIYNSALVFEPVEVGADVWIGPFTVIDGSGGGVVIGDGCQLSAGVHVYTHDTVLRTLSGGVAARTEGRVSIGPHTYIGPHSVVAAGVSIGRQCVVGANSLVTVDVPDRTVVAGSPARVVGRVEGEGADVRMVKGPGAGEG